MCPNELTGWQKHSEHFAHGIGRLDIYHRPGEDHALELAQDYWRGDLPGLIPVKKHDWGGRVEKAQVGSDQKLHYFKRFEIRSPRFIHKPPRARNTLLQETRINDLGFHAARAICLVEHRWAGITLASAVISEAIEDTASLFQLINDPQHGYQDDRRKKRELLRAFGQEVGRWHHAGLFHGDMHLNNVLCRFGDDGVHFFWVDNEEGQRFKCLPFRRRVHDLNHINRYNHRITLSDRMRLWKAYLQEEPLSPAEQKRVVRQVMARSQAYQKKRGWL